MLLNTVKLLGWLFFSLPVIDSFNEQSKLFCVFFLNLAYCPFRNSGRDENVTEGLQLKSVEQQIFLSSSHYCITLVIIRKS
jgi:hypothetical protein